MKSFDIRTIRSDVIRRGETSHQNAVRGFENSIVVVANERMLNVKQVLDRTGLSRTTIWRLEQTNQFPARRSIGPRRVAWLASEIDKWMALSKLGS